MLGVYPIQLAQLAFGKMPNTITANAIVNEEGCDLEVNVKLTYGDDKSACLSASLVKDLDNIGKITGTKGEIIVRYISKINDLLSNVRV